MNTDYDHDIAAWAAEQAALLRAGRWADLDVGHIAEEIEDVGKSEQRELHSRMLVLLEHLIKWQLQRARRGGSWRRTIRKQRIHIAERLRSTPSLKRLLADPGFLRRLWHDAARLADREAGLRGCPADCPWSVEQILDSDFFPEAP